MSIEGFKGTPVPWLRDKYGSLKGANGDDVMVYPGMASRMSGPDDQSVANARLIASAPRMLKALKLVEDWWLEEGMKHFDGAPWAIYEARDAIAEALGVTNDPE